MLKRLLLPAALIALAANVSVAAPSSAASNQIAADTVQKITSLPLFKDMSVTGVAPGPLEGLYEVLIDNRTIVYVSLEKQLVLAGQVFRADGSNLSKDRIREALADRAKEISKAVDKGKAIKIGNGPVEIFEFTDVDCPFCRQSEQYFAGKESSFTRYVILTPLEKQHPESQKKSMYILNSANPAEAYQKAMEGSFDKQVPEFKESAQSKETYRYFAGLSQQFRFKGTPTFVWPEGVSQGLDPKNLDAMVARLKAKDAKEKDAKESKQDKAK